MEEFYRCLEQWKNDGHDESVRVACTEIAECYRRAVDEQIAYLHLLDSPPEAEQELVGGYHTEYSGMKLACFLSAEFLHMVTASFLIVILFFGGWHVWGMPVEAGENVGWPLALARVGILTAKVLLV